MVNKKNKRTTAKPTRSNVTMKKVSNGYVVSSYNDMGNDTTKIAKTKKEATDIANKMLNI